MQIFVLNCLFMNDLTMTFHVYFSASFLMHAFLHAYKGCQNKFRLDRLSSYLHPREGDCLLQPLLEVGVHLDSGKYFAEER